MPRIMGSPPDSVRSYNRHVVVSVHESRTKDQQANTIDRFLTKSLGQVSLLSETVQTMCEDQFGSWIIGVVDVVALVGACLDVFWFDPPPNDPHFLGRWRNWCLVRLPGKISSQRLRHPGFLTNRYLALHANLSMHESNWMVWDL